MLFRLTLLVLAVGLTIFVSLLVSFSDRVRLSTRLTFMSICLSMCLWQINIFVADNVETNLFLLNTVLFIWPSLAIFSTGLFIRHLGRNSTRDSPALFTRRAYLWSLVLLFILQLIPVITGSVFESVTKLSNGDLQLVRGNLYFLYIAALLATFVLFVLRLAYSYRRYHYVDEKKAIKAVFYTLVFVFIYSVITNAIIPIITDSQEYIGLGVFSVVIFVFGLAYSIVRYQFLDIRLIVARSVGYILSLAFIGSLFGLTAFVLFDQLLFSGHDIQIPLPTRIVYVLLALLSGLAFSPAKRLFDKLSNKIFYQDSYNPQWFIDDLTVQITKNVELKPLLEGSSMSIMRSLKPTKLAFIIRLSDDPEDLYFHTNEKHLPSKTELNELSDALSKVEEGIIITEANEQLPGRVRTLLKRYDVELLVHLVSGSKHMGYLALGEKKSGNAYNRQDAEVLDIISAELALAIENALRFDQIQMFNETLQEEVDDATRRLRYSNNKLRALDETKDEFISMASHQLRTPLTSVKGYLSMVLDGDVGELNPQQKKMLTQAFTSSQHMNYLITDLLNVSRLRTGKFVIEKKPVDLSQIINEEIGQLREIAKAKNISLSYDKPETFPSIELDETKTRQIIMNFVDNALHYTPDGGKVRVELEASSSSIELRVVDNGLGVPKDEQHKLFGKFYRAGNARRARPDGTGLGLFMAKKVIIAQGGAIVFKSREGKGSTFGFTFPRSSGKN